MRKGKLIYLPLGVVTGVTAVAGGVLAGSGSMAAATCTTTNGATTCKDTATAKVTVAAGCTFTNESASSESAISVDSGQSATTEANTKTAMALSCNDAGGFAVYAIGNSPATAGGAATEGQTNLVGTNGTIATRAVTSGDLSGWAMKVKTATASTSATIENGYGAYSVVPSSYRKIVSVTGSTSTATTASIRTDYQVYAAKTQAAGDYTGGVKYTVVHPSTATP